MTRSKKTGHKTVEKPASALQQAAGADAPDNSGPGTREPEALPPPTSPPHSRGFPIVGMGASAGGLAAFEAFFSGMPADTDPGMAFVLVQHLAPDHESILAALVQRYTRMKVFEVVDGMAVQVNCAYIIPPNRDMAFLNGTLQLLQPAAPRGHRLPIDFLFRSLAADLQERAIGIVLSGTGSDGTLGVRAIKGGGGMVMAQHPASCEFDGMPRSALATGLVDYELSPGEMPAQLIAYVHQAFGKPSLEGNAPVSAPQTENALKKIFVLVRAQTGHDFSQYKPSTIYRRIERRMAVHQIELIEGYVKYLQQTPVEVEALFRDFLIGVTNFFRDPDAFDMLAEQAIPKLFDSKPAGSVIRVWVAGCSTGEEAYSIAMLLQEQLALLKSQAKLQVFASDIDSHAIATARAARYPASIAVDVAPERLARFFTLEPDGSAYRVHKRIRDLLVFSEHDVIKDPPFSKLDLVSCRNLLIYMGAELQKKLISLFHYALAPGGMLFLGTSETVGEFAELFSVVDRKSKLYRRKEDFQGAKRAALGRFLAQAPSTPAYAAAPDMRAQMGGGTSAGVMRLSLRELTEQALLLQVAPVAALVNKHGDVLYLHGRTGMYLEPAPGDAGINNILKMARQGLKRELTTALHQAATLQERIRMAGLLVKTNGHFTPVNLTVCPVVLAREERPVVGRAASPEAALASTLESPLYIVILEEAPAHDAHPLRPAPQAGEPQPANPSADANAQILELTEELRAKEEHLHAANEELETSNEELKSSNEEMQSVNEELQSTNEELETSKEELQSINEELSTVNSELQMKVHDLSRANNDMNNLLAGTGIGTVFIDYSLRILRFTPSATIIINLIQSDVGRPVNHIVSNLVDYDNLVDDTQAVLKTLQPKEVTVQTKLGKYYTMRILPYRTLENVIEGAVITFVEISEMVHAREALHKANELLRLAVVVRDSFDAITVQDLNGRIIAWNPGAVRLYGWTEPEALAMNVRDRIPQALQTSALAKVHQLSEAEVLEPYFTQRLAKDGTVKEVSLTSTALVNESGQMYAIATTERARVPKAAEPKTRQPRGGYEEDGHE
jgi:two-component system, chemotaxis family, CheB/CheR fusion protein